MAWKEKHEILLKNKNEIIKKYNKNIPIEEIARIYRVSGGCIYKNLSSWGIIKEHGIKFLLRKMILEG